MLNMCNIALARVLKHTLGCKVFEPVDMSEYAVKTQLDGANVCLEPERCLSGLFLVQSLANPRSEEQSSSWQTLQQASCTLRCLLASSILFEQGA